MKMGIRWDSYGRNSSLENCGRLEVKKREKWPNWNEPQSLNEKDTKVAENKSGRGAVPANLQTSEHRVC